MKYLIIIPLILACHTLSFADDTIFISDNKITVHVTNAHLAKVLQEIETATGIRFGIDEDIANDLISVFIDKQDIEKAISRVLSHYSKSSEYDPHGNLKTVYVTPKASRNHNGTQNSPRHKVSNTNPPALIPPQNSETYKSDSSLNMDKTTLVPDIIEEPYSAVIEETPGEMIVDHASASAEIPGKREKNPTQMEVTETDHKAVPPGQDD